MSFDSLSFWIFLPLVWIGWRYLPFGLAKTYALLASLVFYGWWNPFYLVLIVFSAGVDHRVGLAMASTEETRKRKLLLLTSLATNLGLLSIFKYGPFALTSLGTLLGKPPAPEAFVNWVVPVGISFYTFQTLSYTIEVYRRTQPAEKSFRDFLLYVSFFPQLVAGPIVRAGEFLPQLKKRRKIRWVRFEAGIHRCVQGLFLKVVVADNLAPAVTRVFEHGATLGPGEVWLGVIFFGAQIFADFAGYTSIAIGIAMLLGLRFPENFHAPYIARGLSDFWGRWHVTLSTWLRDYLYIPLGGARNGLARTYANLMITMLLGGLWHGASWTFVAWGALHGIGLCVERLLRKGNRVRTTARGSIDPPRGVMDFAGRCASIAVTFAFVHICWVFFRAQDFGNAWSLLDRMLLGPFESGAEFGVASWRYCVFLIPIAIMHLARLAQEWSGRSIPPVWRAITTAFMVVALFVIERAEAPEFLYFQF